MHHSLIEQYEAAKQSAAWIDRSYLGQLEVSGKDHVDLLHRITTNELRHLKPGQTQITVFTNEKGRIIDRVHLLKFDDRIRLITSRATSAKVANWIEKFIFIEDVSVSDVSDQYGSISILGPLGHEVVNDLLGTSATTLEEEHFLKTTREHSEVIVFTGTWAAPPKNLCLIAGANVLPILINKLLGSTHMPLSNEVYNVLRIEAGWSEHGKDFDENDNPHEAGMFPYINFDKGCYVGQEVVARLDTYDKVQKHLVGVLLNEEKMPGAKDVIEIDGREAGYITSSAYSPGLRKNIALGYVRTKFIRPQAPLTIKSNEGELAGELVELPFVSMAREI
ncbi:MAG: hypothetical protein O7G31_01490 [Calditrichaeota bacterium]|nr:hypothetical protein [Calditrichota bacterium]